MAERTCQLIGAKLLILGCRLLIRLFFWILVRKSPRREEGENFFFIFAFMNPFKSKLQFSVHLSSNASYTCIVILLDMARKDTKRDRSR